MKKRNYRISKKAIKDLEGIWKHTLETWSKEQADRYYKLIIDEIEFVADNFEIGRSINHIRKGYRVIQIKSHLIFYRKVGGELVEIIRVLHQRMDIKNRLK